MSTSNIIYIYISKLKIHIINLKQLSSYFKQLVDILEIKFYYTKINKSLKVSKHFTVKHGGHQNISTA